MSKTKDKTKYLENPNIKKITEVNIQFTEDFKLKAIKAYKAGVSAMQIFTEAGISLTDFGEGYARKAIVRWIEAVNKHGLSNLDKERRGVSATGRPGVKKFKTLEEENAYLKAENDFLKKLHALELSYGRRKNTK